MSDTPTPQDTWTEDSAFDAMLTERDRRIAELEAENQTAWNACGAAESEASAYEATIKRLRERMNTDRWELKRLFDMQTELLFPSPPEDTHE